MGEQGRIDAPQHKRAQNLAWGSDEHEPQLPNCRRYTLDHRLTLVVEFSSTMKLCVSFLLPLALIAAATPCFAQTGTVTFYSIGLSAKGELKDSIVPVGTVPFTGWLFDGDKRVAHAQGGRVMTFRVTAGEHQFTVPYHSNRPGKTVLHLKVESEGNYCVRLYAKYVGATVLVPVMYVDSQIEQVSCEQASKEAGSYRPIDLKRVEPAVRPQLNRSPSFPKDN